MSVSIYFNQFDEEKVNNAWNDIYSGKFLIFIIKEIKLLEKNLDKFKDRSSEMTFDEIYSPKFNDKKNDIEKEISKRNIIENKLRQLKWLSESIETVTVNLNTKDQEELDENIFIIDFELIHMYGDKSFSEYLFPLHDDIAILFKHTIGVNISKKYNGDPTLIPQSEWERSFKAITEENIILIRDELTKELSPDAYEEFKYNISQIRGVLKRCVDTKTKFIVNTEQDMELQEPFKTRHKEIVKRLKKIIQ